MPNEFRYIHQVIRYPKHYPESHIEDSICIEGYQFLDILEPVHYVIWRKFDGDNAGYQRLCMGFELIDCDTIEMRDDEVAYLTTHTYVKT